MRIDYPRRGRTGVRHWLPSWRQLLSLVVLGGLALVGTFAVLLLLAYVGSRFVLEVLLGRASA